VSFKQSLQKHPVVYPKAPWPWSARYKTKAQTRYQRPAYRCFPHIWRTAGTQCEGLHQGLWLPCWRILL